MCIFRPLAAGTFIATLYKRYGNIRMSKNVLLLVENEEGVVPQSDIGLHTDYAFSMFTAVDESENFIVYNTDYGFNMFTAVGNYIVHFTDLTRGISPENWDLMQTLYGDDYAWTFEPMGETKLEISAIKENSAFRFKVENYAQMPEGNVNVKAILRWGDATAMTFLHFRFSTLPMPEKINFDEPAAFDWNLLLDHLKMLKKGESIEMPTYSYLTCTRQKETVHMDPHDVVLIEGILVMSDPRLRKMMDIKVFVDADGDDRLIRVISRDCIERGRTAQ